MFLERNLIALEPRNGWRQHQTNQSREAIEWLEYDNSKNGGRIQVSCVKSVHVKKFSCRVLLHVKVSDMIHTVHALSQK